MKAADDTGADFKKNGGITLIHNTSNVKTHLLLTLAALFWGLTPSFIKLSLLELDPYIFSTFRLFLALATSLVLLLIFGSWRRVEKRDWILFSVIGLFGFFVFQLFFPFGVKYTSASISALIMATLPVNVILINLISRTESVKIRTITGIILSIGGITAIVLGTRGGVSLEGTHTRGVVLLIAAELGFAVYTVKSKSLISKYPFYQVMFIVLLFSFIPFLLIAGKDLSVLIQSDSFSNISGTAWIGVIFTGIFGSCIANIFWYQGIHHLGSTRTSVYANLPPVFGIIIGYLFLKETLTVLQIIGGLIIMSGVILVSRRDP